MTLQQLRARLDAYVAAETSILTRGQSYKVGDGATARTFTRADLQQVRTEIVSLQQQIAAAQRAASGRSNLRFFRPNW